MITYQISGSGVIYKDSQSGEIKYIPNDSANSDWLTYQKWLAEGNTPDPEYTLDQRKDMRKGDLMSVMMRYMEGDISYNDKIYSSSGEERNCINTLIASGDRGELTFPLKWNDTSMDPQDLVLDDLKKIQKGEALLIEACADNYGALYTVIDASTDPESVDINADWPTVPYVVA